MSASRRQKANAANARSSTGPTTLAGKARSSQNARRHGLAVSIGIDPEATPAVEELAHVIAGENAGSDCLKLARRIAEAQIDLTRIWQARNLAESDAGMLDVVRIERYERRASSRRKAAIRAFDFFAADKTWESIVEQSELSE